MGGRLLATMLFVYVHTSVHVPQPESLCEVRYQRECYAVVSRAWGFNHPPARAWSEMCPGPQTGACGKTVLVHVGVNPRSPCALCAPTSHDGSIFTRVECEFVRGVFANGLYIVCTTLRCYVRACGAPGCRLQCAVRGTDRGC